MIEKKQRAPPGFAAHGRKRPDAHQRITAQELEMHNHGDIIEGDDATDLREKILMASSEAERNKLVD